MNGANFGPFRSDVADVVVAERHDQVLAGERAPGSPTAETFWAASPAGAGTQTLLWPSQGGRWAIVVMNADGGRGVTAEVSVGARTGVLLPIGIGLGVLGLLLLVGSAFLLWFGLRTEPQHREAVPTTSTPSVAGSFPARLEGHLDPEVSRWLWLVKWVLVVPHVVALAFLWLAVTVLTVLTVVAGFAILFTGRYPRSIFDFNVGVMRWTWRVSFYAISAFATDRYPPFTLQHDPGYPAGFDVDYPERLSRGLVLVKWWLLVLPHYLIVAVFAGGWGFGWNGGWRVAGGGGLIALLSIIVAIVLAVRGQYPPSIFDFVMGVNRWCYRVLGYAALMRDEYPPFRLDSGGTDPGSLPAGPPPVAPDRPGEMIATSR